MSARRRDSPDRKARRGRHRVRSGFLVAAGLTSLAVASSCADRPDARAGGGEATGAHDDPRAVASRGAKHAQLLQIAEELRGSHNLYNGEIPWRRLQRVDKSTLTGDDLVEHEFALGMEHFKFDHLEEAISAFGRAYELKPHVRTGFMLAMAHLQTGVRENCIGFHNPASCVFPLAGEGVYRAQEGVEKALAIFVETLPLTPREQLPRVRWFVNLAALALGRHPEAVPRGLEIDPSRFRSDYDIGHFPDVAIETGVAPMNLAGGSVLEDFDGDGLLDLMTSSQDPFGQLLYYRNRGDGSFEDRTEAAGLLGQLGGLNLVHADYDGDGDRDVLLLRGGWLGMAGRMPKSLLRNRGDGTFDDVTVEAGLGPPDYPSQTAAFADYDLDGDLDLFVGNEVAEVETVERYPCQLYRNEGDGRFTEHAAAAGVENGRLTKGVAWGDYDDDRYPDLYCSNQFGENRLYHNNGDGTFTDVGEELGVRDRRFSFSVWFWDYDNDGKLDLFVAGYGGDMNTFVRSYLRPAPKFGLNSLFRNEGGTFRDVAKDAGLTLQVLTMGANFGDLDNDGWLDFYLGTGAPDYDALQPNVMYRNDGHGAFQDVTTSGGFGQIRKGHAIAWGDIDNDGDQDLYLQSGGFYPYDGFFNSLFLNPGHGQHWIALRLQGNRSNRDAFGTRIRVRVVEGGEPRDLYRWVWPSGSFGSSSLQQEIGLGQAERVESVELYWPATDVTQVLRDLDLDACYLVTEGAAHAEKVPRKLLRFGT